ncbi:DNA excision repair protein ERCC-6-like [Varanus komodoensis]|uniref:DNA excision repair protein ERCC-6-like n=1 Tax=Varanus komodoensis TaxID=61221 RepID=A0A8D2LQS9_VARKO|nr:DNA excision repair protein ERCC-6-like [Varanus komodoensis]
MAEPLDPAQAEQYRSYVCQAKQEARNGKLEESIRLFRQAFEIHPSEKLKSNIRKLEEALASLALDQEEDGFVDVCQSGLLLYGEMHDKLFGYQREGVAFLYSLYRDGRRGGILADDMGLGKTVQIIAFLSGMFDAERIQSVLLIMPTTLVNNWMKEFAKWTPGLRIKPFYGACKTERTRNLERIQRKNGVLLTTYQMLLNNWQQLSSYAGKEFVWDYVILDEAHKIKTPSAKTTKAVHAIPSKNRILLTGTPIQNNLKELWSLFDFACQGMLLGTMKTFKMEYENPITRARAKDATPGEKALGLKISESLMSIIKPYFLRRSKDELQKKVKHELKSNLLEEPSNDTPPAMPSLPRKNDFIVWLYLTPIQEEIYRNFLSLDHIKELLMTTRSPLAELNVLKKVCDHPRLLSARACQQLGLETSDPDRAGDGENAAGELWSTKRSIEHISDEVLIEESGKLQFLMALLERLREEGHRTLVFSQSRKMLDIIEHLLTLKRFRLMRIDGTVTHLEEREKRIGVFQKNRDYSIFLLTTQVGGVGLTLTAATRVVIFDPSWNPATDAQAVDRAYRIGQKNNVVIYRLITCGTVEEKIYRRQVFKDSLIRQSTGDNRNPYRYFTQQELRELFTLGDTQSSATQLQLQSLHANQRKTDSQLDEHIAYLYSLNIFGISDHDLIYTQEKIHEDEAEDEEARQYIKGRVQKAQELVQLESQVKDQGMGYIKNMTEGAWLREMQSSTQPKKKPPKPSPKSNLISPVSVEPTKNDEFVNLVSDDDNTQDIVNVSSRMTSLVIEDVEDVQMLQNISNIDPSLSKNECDPERMQEYKQKHDLSKRSPFPHAHALSNKENYSPESEVMSCDLPGEDGDDEQVNWSISHTDASLSKSKEHNKLAQLLEYEQKHIPSTRSSFLQASPLCKMENHSPESKIASYHSTGKANSVFDDVQMELLQQSFEHVSDDGKQQIKSETCLDVATSTHTETCESNELKAKSPFPLQANKMSWFSTDQKSRMSGIMLEDESFSGSSPYQANFNLALEESMEERQDISKTDVSVEYIENEGFQLKVDSSGSSLAHSGVGENRGSGRIGPSKNIIGSAILDSSNNTHESLMDDSEVSFHCKKKTVRRIVSDEEEENVGLENLDDMRIKSYDLNNLDEICMSTPKSNRLIASFSFSPRIKVSGRRSTASRRSIVNMVQDQLEDMKETVESVNDNSQEISFQKDFDSRSTSLSMELEEETASETADSGKMAFLLSE